MVQELFEIEGNSKTISLEKLKQLEPLKGYLYLLFQEYGFTQWEDMVSLLEASSGKEIRSHTHRLVKDREQLILAPLSITKSTRYWLEEEQKSMEHPVQLQIETTNTLGPFSENVLYVDKEKLNYPLKIRNWEIGDYFYPLGMSGRKKLSKFFKDEKYTTIAKEQQWMLCSGDEIVWIIGKRADNRFKVTDTTKEIVKITLI